MVLLRTNSSVKHCRSQRYAFTPLYEKRTDVFGSFWQETRFVRRSRRLRRNSEAIFRQTHSVCSRHTQRARHLRLLGEYAFIPLYEKRTDVFGSFWQETRFVRRSRRLRRNSEAIPMVLETTTLPLSHSPMSVLSYASDLLRRNLFYNATSRKVNRNRLF